MVRRRDDARLKRRGSVAEAELLKEIVEYARRVADRAPPLTEEQRAVLRELLRPRTRQKASEEPGAT
ncbi:hypothetical protein GCM10009531_60790 [Actinoplanes capillaceus]